MESVFKAVAGSIALGVEAAAALIVAFAAIEAIYGAALAIPAAPNRAGRRKEVWLRFAVWLVLGLEFELAADVVRTAISPTWNEIAQLAAIAGIRTFLNLFLERDLESYKGRPSSAGHVAIQP
jgi:uncharacterized membrane protein